MKTIFLLVMMTLLLPVHILAQVPTTAPEEPTIPPIPQDKAGDVDFLYDGQGQRIARLVSGGERTYYISPGLEVTVKADGSASWKRSYGATAVREGSSTGQKLSFIYSDHLGSTSQVYDDQGNVVAQQVYYPYGTTRSTAGILPTDKEYTGQMSDINETGLYYYNARYYNPTLAKFTQADQSADGLNKYAYVGNNPVNSIDPTGKRTEEQDPLAFDEKEYHETVFYRNLINNFKKGMDPAWDYMSYEERLNNLSSYIYFNIPYSKRLLDVWGRIAQAKQAYQNAESSGVSGTEKDNLYNQWMNEIKNEGDLWIEYGAWEEDATSYDRYKSDLFQCSDYSNLFNILVNELMPEIPIYSVNSYEDSHAWNLAIVNNNLYTIDVTNNLPLTQIDVDIANRPYLKVYQGIGGFAINPYFSTYNTSLLKSFLPNYINITFEKELQ